MNEKNRIFIIDDEPDILSSLTRLLLDEPYEVQTFTNGFDAIDYVKENLVDRWGVGVAPAMLFGEFGKAIGNGWEALTTSERSYVADLVEKAVTQGSVPLKSMIEQGLLSGLAGELASHPERLEAVASILGQASLASVQSQVRLLPQQRT
jgi:CheY-like chemotaxis protein